MYELRVRTFLLKDLKGDQSIKKISQSIITYLSKDRYFLNYHISKSYKSYCHDNLYPISKSYKKNEVYQFRIRSIDKDLVNYFLKGFSDYKDEIFKNLTVEVRIISKSIISKIFTLSPVILKNDSGYWRNNMSVEDFEKRINDNIIKKYKFFENDKIKELKFYNNIKFLNSSPVPFKFKDITLLGDKVELNINMDENSQNLAYLALGVTFSENSTYGAGFLGYKYLD
ncbi:CRISPR-associated endoribonuclease Cas6 [Anaerococcus porci]|uniref:CRISPR-associated endoribonuclease Cas6 n=1 Tax=Anaerococcus porci TaxID=2652269 RepID=UPI002A754AB3|nr:CRISPR-associated endoribonuclease Cas6 [Anaerococcus porci]MDY3006370.1 CRISPR-associated endoribonuclease Cas6 [Anaerococcus porci]